MIIVSIACMIYKSPKFADWVYESVMEHTPMLKRGEAEFFFIANDPTVQLVDHLREKNYPFVIALHDRKQDEELIQMGIEGKEYLHRVYRSWNQAIMHARGQMVCLINSDNYFSENWLENMLKYANNDTYVVPQLIEPKNRKRGTVFWCAINKEYGNTPESFDKESFFRFADSIRQTGYRRLGVFQPCLFYKDTALFAGLYNEGNKINDDGSISTGDELFRDKMLSLGVKHITALDSIVYHLGEGEMLDDSVDETLLCDREYAGSDYIEELRPLAKCSIDHIGGELPVTKNASMILERIEVPYDECDEVNMMRDRLVEYLHVYENRKLYLYCAGRNGKTLHRELLIRGIDVYAFSDSNELLWEKRIDSINCVSPEEIPHDGIIIVTKDNPDELVTKLKNNGYQYVFSFEEIKKLINNIPRI